MWGWFLFSFREDWGQWLKRERQRPILEQSQVVLHFIPSFPVSISRKLALLGSNKGYQGWNLQAEKHSQNLRKSGVQSPAPDPNCIQRIIKTASHIWEVFVVCLFCFDFIFVRELIFNLFVFNLWDYNIIPSFPPSLSSQTLPGTPSWSLSNSGSLFQ